MEGLMQPNYFDPKFIEELSFKLHENIMKFKEKQEELMHLLSMITSNFNEDIISIIHTNRKLIKELEKTQTNINIEKINFLNRCLEDKDQKNN
tara:strand:+ start:2975 stop:3253 length:279 start_codon:yes stop_codon:yes gene_type:complete